MLKNWPSITFGLVICIQTWTLGKFQILDCWRLGINYPCICHGEINEVNILCDEIAFTGFPKILHQLKIKTFSHTNSGLQTLETAMFALADITIRNIDFSYNHLFSISRNAFAGIESSLEKLNLSHNFLGDIFETKVQINEFQDLNNLQVLDLSYNQIKDFANETFISLEKLTELHLEGNKLTTIPQSIGHLKQLEILNLRNNKLTTISSIDLQYFSNLKILMVDKNFIHNISPTAFENLPLKKISLNYNLLEELPQELFNFAASTLKSLDISYNVFNKVPHEALQNVTNLQELSLQGNFIQELDDFELASLNNLEVLDLSRNRVTNLPSNIFNRLENLKSLQLGINPIKRISNESLNGLDKLEKLSMMDLSLSEIPSSILQPLSHIKNLDLSHNKIGRITDGSFRGIVTIETLNLDNNLISELQESSFKILFSLKHLKMRGNRLKDIKSEIWTGINDHLEYLDLSKNKFSNLPQLSMPLLVNLNMAENNIEKLLPNSFTNLPNLKILDLSYNQLASVQLSSMVSLKKLTNLQLHHNEINIFEDKLLIPAIEIFNASYNRLPNINATMFKDLLNLSDVDLDNNAIQRIEGGAFENLPNLKYLSLNKNQLTAFSLASIVNAPKLQQLNLGINSITSISTKDFANNFLKLEKLALCHNELTIIEPRTFQAFPKLKNLDISDNSLSVILPNIFTDMFSLRILDLSNNIIQNISEHAFQNSHQLYKLDISDNKLTTLSSHVFSTLNRLDLDLSHNHISLLPNDIFSPSNIDRLQKLNLSFNKIDLVPFQPLRSQDFNLLELDLSHNNIHDVPNGVLINVHILNMSNNPLSQRAFLTLLNIPRLVRDLNLANTGLTIVPQLETPFIRILNLSGNSIGNLQLQQFDKAKTLETLDLSHNQLKSISLNLASIWLQLIRLEFVDLSDNPIVKIENNDFQGLNQLNTLVLKDLPLLTGFDVKALQNLTALQKLYIGPYRSLARLDAENMLNNIQHLEELEIEIKELTLDKQLQKQFSSRIKKIGLSGDNLDDISDAAFVGVNNPEVKFTFRHLIMPALNATPFYNLPRSTNPQIDFTNSDISYSNLSNLIRQLRASGRDIKISKAFPLCNCVLKGYWKSLKDLIVNHPKQAGLDLSGITCTNFQTQEHVSLMNIVENAFEKCTNNSDARMTLLILPHPKVKLINPTTATTQEIFKSSTIASEMVTGQVLAENEGKLSTTTIPNGPTQNENINTLSHDLPIISNINSLLAPNRSFRGDGNDIPVPIILMSQPNQDLKPFTISSSNANSTDLNPLRMITPPSFITVIPLDVNNGQQIVSTNSLEKNDEDTKVLTIPSLESPLQNMRLSDATVSSPITFENFTKPSVLMADVINNLNQEQPQHSFITVSPLPAHEEINNQPFISDANLNLPHDSQAPIIVIPTMQSKNTTIIVPPLTSTQDSQNHQIENLTEERFHVQDFKEVRQIEQPEQAQKEKLSLLGSFKTNDNKFVLNITDEELQFESITGFPKIKLDFIDSEKSFANSYPMTQIPENVTGTFATDEVEHIPSAQMEDPPTQSNATIGIILGSVFGSIALIIIITVIIGVIIQRRRSKMYPSLQISKPMPKLCICHIKNSRCPLHRNTDYNITD